MKHKRSNFFYKRIISATLSAVIIVVTAACSSSPDTSSSEQSEVTEATEQAPAAVETAETLTVALGSEPGSLDPLLKSDGSRDNFSLSVYEGLTVRVGDGSGSEIVSGLAASWTLDGTAWIFKLREGVIFHNGQALTSADVVASWKRMLSEGSEHLGSKVLADHEVVAIDGMTVSISRPVADPTTPARAALVMIVPAEYANLPDDRLASEMVGTGPYQMTEWSRGEKIVLASFDGYWGEQPSIKSVNLVFSEEVAVRMAALQAGEVDMSLGMIADLASDEFVSVGTPVSEVSIMRLNSKFGPFVDPRVRKAADIAIDRQLLIDEIWGGFASSANGQEVSAYVFGHNPNLSAAEFNPEEARRLLTEAGAIGAKVDIYGTRGRWNNSALQGAAIAKMLNDVGFEATLVEPPFGAWVKKVFIAQTDASQAPDMTLYNHSNELFDSSQTIGQNLTCKGSASTTCIPEVDVLAEKALAAGSDLKARQDMYNQIWKILQENNAFISLGEVQKITFHSKNLSWVPEPDGFLRFQFMSFKS